MIFRFQKPNFECHRWSLPSRARKRERSVKNCSLRDSNLQPSSHKFRRPISRATQLIHFIEIFTLHSPALLLVWPAFNWKLYDTSESSVVFYLQSYHRAGSEPTTLIQTTATASLSQSALVMLIMTWLAALFSAIMTERKPKIGKDRQGFNESGDFWLRLRLGEPALCRNFFQLW